MRIITRPTIASKEWVYRQYDHMVRTNTIVFPGSDAAVIRIKETRRALAMSLDSNARYCQADPRAGARLVVAEAARNLAATGARAVALTNCLNFASPERAETMWQFSEVIDGMAEACAALSTPVTGGNVSFYNETDGRGIYPTPVIGMVGIVEDLRHITTQWFKHEGRAVILIGATENDLGASEYALVSLGKIEGRVPALDLERERRVEETCLRIIQAGLVESAHDVSDGGLSVAIAECAFSSYGRSAVGCEINLEGSLSAAAMLFSETPSRILVSAEPESVDRILEIAREQGATAKVVGHTGGEQLVIKANGETIINRSVVEVEQAWRKVLPEMLEVASLIAAEESLTS
jgi:phosphoribosylformylglycinamidine synthase